MAKLCVTPKRDTVCRCGFKACRMIGNSPFLGSAEKGLIETDEDAFLEDWKWHAVKDFVKGIKIINRLYEICFLSQSGKIQKG